MPSNIPLQTLQRWMQHVIEHPGTDAEAWNSEQAQNEISYEEAYLNVVPSATLSQVERIGIYRRMFGLRMCEAMEIDYPGVKHYVGETSFNDIVMQYVSAYPSTSYTLNHLGRNFPRFVSESALPDKEFLHELARLELALTENMDAPDSVILTHQEIAAVAPDDWASVSLIPISALELLTFDFPVGEYLRRVIDEEPTEKIIQRSSCAIVVYRKNYTTWFKELSAEEYMLLRLLCSSTSLADSLETLVESFPDKQTELEHHVFEWFVDWVRRGMFSRIEGTRK